MRAVSVYPTNSLNGRALLFEKHNVDARPEWEGFCFPSVVFDPRFEQPYRLYFGFHSGDELHVALAESIEGPWQVQKDPVIRLEDIKGARGHIASPDVTLHKNGTYELFLHAPRRSGRQVTFLADSRNGLKFRPKFSIGRRMPSYARAFEVDGQAFAMTKGGDIFKKSFLGTWSSVGNPFTGGARGRSSHNYVGAVRHVGILRLADELYVFFTKIGDSPERVLGACLVLEKKGPKSVFRVSDTHEIFSPLEKWEGAKLEVIPSSKGASVHQENALRDPFPFIDRDSGIVHFFYVGGGESCLAKTSIPVDELTLLMSDSKTSRSTGSLPLVCVVGFGHSGTTLAYRMLTESPRSSSFPFETRQFSNGVNLKLAELLVDRGRYLSPPEVIIEKTPAHALRIQEISETLPKTRFVFMIRDIRDVAGSLLRRHNDWLKVQDRLDKMVKALREFEGLESVLVVKYEELVTKPDQVLKLICNHANLTWSPKMLDFHNSTVPWQGLLPSVNKGTEAPSPDQHKERRAYQVGRELYNGTGEGRLGLTKHQLEFVEARYVGFQKQYGYSQSLLSNGTFQT
jgi:hypothetical protein